MTESTGMPIRKERLMVRARASLGITTHEPYIASETLTGYPELTDTTKLASSSCLKCDGPNEHGESFDLGSKDARKSKSEVSCHKKTRSINSLGCEAREKVTSGDDRVDPELEHALHQVEIQRRAIKDHQSERKEVEEKVVQSSHEKEHAETEEVRGLRAQQEQRLHALDHQLRELWGWSEEAEQTMLKAKLEIERLEQHDRDSFNAGRAAGMLEMAASGECRAVIRQATLSGIREYLRSPTFELILAAKAAEHEAIGFMRCRSRALELSGFKEGFDVGLLDSAKGGNLELPPSTEEFGNLEDKKYMINK